MSIKVICPNGHTLQVRADFAGKAGLCPHCKAPIVVPEAEHKPMSEDDLLKVLDPGAAHRAPVGSEPQSPQQPQTHGEEAKQGPAAKPRGAAILRRSKVCPKCCDFVSMSHANCPRCHRPLSDWVFPLPQERASEASGPAAASVLGLRTHGNVTVVGLGVNRILDEMTIKKFGEELFHAVNRPDCQNFLLDFTGVMAMSSAMLGVLLLLRKKISQKSGSLKFCHVGPEIMDVFQATKLGQLFEILENEQKGLNAFHA